MYDGYLLNHTPVGTRLAEIRRLAQPPPPAATRLAGWASGPPSQPRRSQRWELSVTKSVQIGVPATVTNYYKLQSTD